jgi:regulator of nucleoside diphosphate kinase
MLISQFDHDRLRLLLARVSSAADRDRVLPHKLRGELDRAMILTPEELPAGVVTMGARIWMQDIESREVEVYTLTFPEQADPEEHRLSVLAPIGNAILGYADGDELAWETPGGIRRIRLPRLLHPREADAHAS